MEDRSVPSATPTVDLTTAGASGTINGAIFQQMDFQPAGCGALNPFVRIQAHGSTVEQGYNTDARPLQFDELTSATFTHSIRLSDVPLVALPTGLYREFVLDINQNGAHPQLSLDELRIYDGGAANLLGFDGGSAQLATLSPLYDMSAGGEHWVALNGSLAPGIGKGDMVLYVPNTDFAGKSPNSYVYLYSQFGANAPANGGFEQWAVGNAAVTPPPYIAPASVSGFVLSNTTGFGLAGVTITLTGTTLTGQSVTLTAITDSNGYYSFSSLAAGTYTLTQTVPTNYVAMGASAGTVGGVTDGSVVNGMIASIALAAGSDGVQYNFIDAVPGGLGA